VHNSKNAENSITSFFLSGFLFLISGAGGWSAIFASEEWSASKVTSFFSGHGITTLVVGVEEEKVPQKSIYNDFRLSATRDGFPRRFPGAPDKGGCERSVGNGQSGTSGK